MVGFQAAYARRGISFELGERLALGYQFHIASSREQAIREAVPHYQENMKIFGELRLVRALSDGQIAAMRDPRLVSTVDVQRADLDRFAKEMIPAFRDTRTAAAQ